MGIVKGTTNLIGRAIGGVGTVAIGGTAKVAGDAASGLLEGIGEGIVGTVKGAGALKRKILGDAAEEAVDAGTDAVVHKATRDSNVFFNSGGNDYRMLLNKNENGDIIGRSYARKQANGNYTEISGKAYGKAKAKASDFFADEESLNGLDIAESISKTAAGDGAGFNFGDFMDNHPVAGPAMIFGGGILAANVLGGDD